MISVSITSQMRDGKKALFVVFRNDDGWIQIDCYVFEGRPDPIVTYQINDQDFEELCQTFSSLGDLI